ncbi:S-adenosylmethionine decarboxylase [Peribacillus sp. V2I11]|uniref:S-adenosylmethionine decarboxylase n=1 Tax=Peribacillus sp. V2I11 TaxID=3042277 RepID=UPI0035945171
MEILHTHFHSFLPHGVTGAIILSTSHFSIQTVAGTPLCSFRFIYVRKSGIMASIRRAS